MVLGDAGALRRSTDRGATFGLGGRATLDELVAATGWLPHTTRAALTRLRQSGHAIHKAKDDQNRTVYRITETTSTADDQPVNAGEAACAWPGAAWEPAA